jgi:hypothetical protein
MMRLDVRGTAGQQDRIEVGRELPHIEHVAQCGNQDRYRLSPFRHCFDVLLADAVEVVMAQQTPIRRNADDGFAR